jgi:RNA polymerase sigma-70 factor (ECF subfamily)
MSKAPSENLVKKFLEHREGLFGFVLALTRNRQAAEEIFQDIGLVIVEEARRGTQVDRFLPWAHEIVRRRVAEYFRKEGRRHAALAPADLEDAVSQSFQEFALDPAQVERRGRLLEACLEELSSPQRDLLERRYRDHTPLRALAERLKTTEGSLKVILWRIRRQLARCVEGKMGGVEGGT